MTAAAKGAPPRLLISLPQIYAAGAVRLVLPLAVLPLIASRLGAEEFGRLGFILVWGGLLAALVEGGFLAAATRLAVAASAVRRWQLAQQVFTARCILSLPAALLAFAAVRWASPDASHPLADSCAIAALACAFGWPATWYLQATQQLNRWARVEILVYGAFIAACWLFAGNVAEYVALQVATSAALAGIGWRWLRADLADVAGSNALWQRAELRAGLRLGATMLPVSIAGAAYSLALPAAASAQLSKPELGVYFMADRIVRALLAAADPVFSVVYPRIVALFTRSGRAALWYAARWAAVGTVAGAIAFAAVQAGWPLLEPILVARAGGIDVQAVHAVASVLAGLWPLLLGWKFFGYWMLGSGRHDTAYRSSIVVGGVAGVAAAATIGGAAGALGLAWTALGVEALVIAVAVASMAAGRLGRHVA
ncbi:MAG: oligosaccharide flippase family protein [Caldimonas sp.]